MNTGPVHVLNLGSIFKSPGEILRTPGSRLHLQAHMILGIPLNLSELQLFIFKMETTETDSLFIKAGSLCDLGRIGGGAS